MHSLATSPSIFSWETAYDNTVSSSVHSKITAYYLMTASQMMISNTSNKTLSIPTKNSAKWSRLYNPNYITIKV